MITKRYILRLVFNQLVIAVVASLYMHDTCLNSTQYELNSNPLTHPSAFAENYVKQRNFHLIQCTAHT